MLFIAFSMAFTAESLYTEKQCKVRCQENPGFSPQKEKLGSSTVFFIRQAARSAGWEKSLKNFKWKIVPLNTRIVGSNFRIFRFN